MVHVKAGGHDCTLGDKCDCFIRTLVSRDMRAGQCTAIQATLDKIKNKRQSKRVLVSSIVTGDMNVDDKRGSVVEPEPDSPKATESIDQLELDLDSAAALGLSADDELSCERRTVPVQQPATTSGHSATSETATPPVQRPSRT